MIRKPRTSLKVNKLPKAFHVWWDELCKKYPFTTIEIKNGEVAVCRAMVPIKDLSNIKELEYGKIIRDSVGLCIERTFIPKYIPEEDRVASD